MRVAFHTLGCKVNQYETEAIKEAFVERGAEIVSEEAEADVYIVNTCTVTNIADRKSRQYIRRMKRISPSAIMVVTGCYAQVAYEDLESMDEIDMIIGNGLKGSICDKVYEEFNNRSSACYTQVFARKDMCEYEDMGLVISSESHLARAYIKIQEGCDRFCSYCMIPFARGQVRSRSVESVLDEARALIARGFKEIVLTGINTALYGTEEGFDWEHIPGEEHYTGLETIISRINDIEGDFRIRLSSLEPTVVDKEHVEKIIRFEKLCHHLHLSIQSGSTDVIRRMNRHYTAEDYLDIVKAIRKFDPLYGITTDIIVGFPGETEEEFADSLRMVHAAEFEKVHAFRYSPRKGTVGASLSGAVPGHVKNERVDRLIEEAEQVAEEFWHKNSSVSHKVLIEEHCDGYATGYTDNYIKVYIEDGNCELADGEFCHAMLIGRYNDGCEARVAEKGR